MSTSPDSKDSNLKELLKEVGLGKCKLPNFQRSWTWDDSRIKAIIASVSQGYPMGAIMRLSCGNPDIKFDSRPLEGTNDSDAVKNALPETLVLDGQQRLTSLFWALYSDKVVKTQGAKKKEIERFYYLAMEKCLDEREDRMDAVISVPGDRQIKTDFDRKVLLDLSDHEKEYEHKMFPLNIVFSNELTDWIIGYWAHYQGNNEATEIFKKFKSEVIDTILEYKLPVITLDKNTPLEAVCKIFENVNTGAVKLTIFELVTATFAPNGCNLRDDWTKCRDIIQANGQLLRSDVLDDVSETDFLTAITLYTSYLDKQAGKTKSVSCKNRDVLALEYNSYLQNKEQMLVGFQLAREFLLKQHVFRKRDLPYTTQLIPLSVVCAVLGESKCHNPNVEKVLAKWYWCGIFGEMYGAANETRYANDIEDVVAEINGEKNPSRTVNAAFFSAIRLLTLQTRNSAAYKGVMALLYQENCRDFMNNVTIDIANCMIESSDIHHVFPRNYCESRGIPREKYNSIANKTPLLPATNRFIGGNAPSKYLGAILRNVDGLSEDELKLRVESHSIDYDLLQSDDFDAYFIDRAKKILTLIEKAMGKPVADRGAEETVKQFGGSLA